MNKKKYIRSLDELGRIVVPKEIRKNLQLGEKQMLEISTEGEKITIEKYDNLVPCLVTGVSNKGNHTFIFGNGALTLSPQGIDELIKELEDFKSSNEES